MEGQAGITRIICGVLTALVSACLLTCAFVNVAFAVSTELPAGSFEDGLDSYNPPGYLFGLNTGIFNSAWTSGTSIFAKQWSSASLGAATGNVLLAVNADLNRMTNNYLYVINNSLTTIKSDISYIRENTFKTSSNTAGMLQELEQDSRFVTGSETDTHTIRYYIKLIKDYVYDIKQNVQGLKNNSAALFTELMYDNNSDYGDRNTLRWYIKYAYYQLEQISSSSSNHLTNIDTYAEQIRTYSRSIDSNVNSINTSLSSNLPSIASDVNAMRMNFDATVSSINDSLLDVTTALGSGGYIGQQLAQLNDSLSSLSTAFGNFVKTYNSTISNMPNQTGGGPIYYVKALPLAYEDGAAISTWTRDVRNYLRTISQTVEYDYTSQLSAIVDSLGSGGYIGQQLAQLKDSLSSLSTAFGNFVKTYNSTISNMPNQTGGGPIYYVKALPIAYDDGAAIPTWTRDVRNYLRIISAKQINDYTEILNQIESDANLIGSHLETIIELIRNLDLTVNVNIPDNSQELIGDFDTDAFKTNSDLLIDRVSQLAPFGAITVASAELGILTQVDPIQKPSMEIPFNFSLTDENVVLDMSWLDDAKPLFNFIMEFLFVLMLLTVTMKYVRQEATS